MVNRHSPRYLAVSIASASLLTFAATSQATDGIKADNPDDLNLASSWVGGSLPDAVGTALFGSSITSDQSYALGSSLTWGGITVTNPGGIQTITPSPGQVLSLGNAGVSMGTATANLVIQSNLYLAATQTWTIGSGRTLTVTGQVAGDLGTNLVKAGSGGLVLSGANTFAGNVNVTEGNVTLGGSSVLPSTTVVSVGGNGTSQFILNGNSQTIAGLSTLTGGTRRVTGNHASALSVLTLNPAAASTYTYAGQVGNGTNVNPNRIALVKTGAGLQELTSTTGLTYTGNTTIQEGALGFNVANGPASSFVVLDGGVFQGLGTTPLTFTRSIGTSGSSAFQWTTNGGGFSAKGSKFTVNIGGASAPLNFGSDSAIEIVGPLKFGHSTATADTEFQNPLNLNGSARTIDVTDNPASSADFATLSGVIADGTASAGITKTGSGTLVLSASNTYSGTTTINAGTLAATTPASLPGYATSGRVVVQSVGTLQARMGGLTDWQASDIQTLLGAVNFAAGSGLAIDTAGSSVTLPISITLAGLRLGKAGAGTLLLTGNNTHSGGTELLGGVLQIPSAAVLGSGPVIFSGGTLASSDTTPRTIPNAVSFRGPSGFGDSPTSGALTLDGAIDFAAAPRNVTVNSALTLAGASSNGGLGQKLGPGTLTVTGDANWTGGGVVEVREGTLVIDGTDILNNDALRVMSVTPGGTARVEIKSGSSFTIQRNTGNYRIGYSPGGDATATNIADVSGSLLFSTVGSGGLVQLGTSSAKAILNLNPGGLIATRGVSTGPAPVGETEANFDGGTLKAIQSSGSFLQNLMHAYIKAGGLIVDSNGFDVTIAQTLEHSPTLGVAADGGITKTGLGSLTLSGTSTLDGPININQGALLVTGSVTGRSLTVNAGGTLGGSGPVVLSDALGASIRAGGSIAPGTGIGTLSIVSSGGQLSLSDAVSGASTGALVFELGSGFGDTISLTGGAFNIGTGVLGFDDFQFLDAGGLGIGTYTLFDGTVPIIGQLDVAHLSGSIGAFTGTLGFAESGNDLVLSVVPEPGTAAVLLAGCVGLLSRRNRPGRRGGWR